MKRILPKSKILVAFLFFAVFMCGNTVSGQTTGDYRSIVTGNWTTFSSWEYYNGTSWVAATSYPGQNTGTGAVLIQSGHTISIGTSGITTQTIGTVTISGKLNLTGLGTGQGSVFNIQTSKLIVTPGLSPVATIAFDQKVTLVLPTNVELQVSTGGLSTVSGCSNNQEIQIGSTSIAFCTGSTNFATLMSQGGYNTAGTLSGNQYICTYGTTTTTFSSTSSGGAWSSGSPLIATVNSSTGVVTAIAVGSATITYTRSGVTGTRNVYVGNTPSANAVLTGSTTQCQNTTTSYTASPVSGSSSYTWSYDGSGATITPAANGLSASISFSSTATSGNLKVTTTNGCGSAGGGNELWITINPIITAVPVATSISGNVQCDYAEPRWNTVSNATGYFLDIATDSGFTNFVGVYNNYVVTGNNSSSPVFNLPAGVLYYRVRAYNTFCTTTANSNTVSFQTTAPVGGSISPAQTICSGNSPTSNLTLSGYTTNAVIVKWQKASNVGFTANVSDISETTNVLSIAKIGVLTTNTYFRAVVQNQFGSWCSSNSTPVLITVGNSISAASSTPTICINTALTPITHTTSGFTGMGTPTGLPTGVTASFASNTVTISGTPTILGTFNYTVPLTGSCGTANATGTITVNPSLTASVSITASPSGAICSGTSVTFTATPTNGGTTPAYQWKVNGVDAGTNSSTFTTISLANNDIVTVVMTSNASPCLTGSPATSNSLMISVNPTPSTPTVGTITNISCTTTGSIELTGLPSGNWTINQTGTVITSYNGSTASTIISGLGAGSYTFTVSADGCPSGATTAVPISNTATIWNGSTWSHGDPDETKSAIITSVPTYTFAADFTACSLTIDSGVVATVNSGVTLRIINEVTTNGQLIFENDASLVQVADVAVNNNSGNITYKRVSDLMKNFDYTYWSSPVAGQTLVGLSPNTLSDKYFSYSGAGWSQETPSNVMKPGIGYIIRVPKPHFWPIPTASSYAQPVEFTGIPNNGDITSSQALTMGKFYLIGNPYPSALDADEFLFGNLHNRAILGGTIYFWTHNTAIQNVGPKYVYVSDDYASYNLTGGVASAPSDPNHDVNGVDNGKKPTGFIAAGQSFFASAADGSGNVEFTNKMRIGGTYNAQFFKPAKTSKSTVLKKNRLWLNMTNTGGAYKQALIGYIEGATNTYDEKFDGLSFDGNSYIDFYSINATNNLAIQARALPFTDTDVVPLGYRSTIAGDFTISIDEADGDLATQRIYLEDKQTNTINELTANNYTFTTKAGTFKDRFVLRYTNKTLGTGDFETVDDAVSVVIQNKTVTINSTVESIDKVFIYDITGKQLYKKDNVNNLELILQNLPFAQQVLLVKVVLDNGYETTEKVIFK